MDSNSAICFRCGTTKAGALVPCPDCGALPTSDDDTALSLALTERHFGSQTLEQFGRLIASGQKPSLDAESHENLVEHVRQMRKAEEARESQNQEEPFEQKPLLSFEKKSSPWFHLATLQLLVMLTGVVIAGLAGVEKQEVQDPLGRSALICWGLFMFVIPMLAFLFPRIAGSYRFIVVIGIVGTLLMPVAYLAPELFMQPE